MTELSQFLTIGEVAARSGVATSALRFYEEQGLIASERTSGNQRRYRRAVLRRVAVIRAAQAIGVSLREIRSALDALPDGRTPNKADWASLSRGWRDQLEERIEMLEEVERELDRLHRLWLPVSAVVLAVQRGGRDRISRRWQLADGKTCGEAPIL